MSLYGLACSTPEAACLDFAIWQAPDRFQSCSRTGLRISEIIRSVKEVRQWLPQADLSNLRLHPAAHHGIEIEQPDGRTDKRGQFVLPVTPPEQNADALFERAQAAEEIGDRAEAERLYRVLMKSDPTDAAPPFNLGNMLRADGRKVEAEAAFGPRHALIRCSRRPGTISSATRETFGAISRRSSMRFAPRTF